MVECPDCGHQVPVLNMEFHKIRFCNPRKQAAARPKSDKEEDQVDKEKAQEGEKSLNDSTDEISTTPLKRQASEMEAENDDEVQVLHVPPVVAAPPIDLTASPPPEMPAHRRFRRQRSRQTSSATFRTTSSSSTSDEAAIEIHSSDEETTKRRQRRKEDDRKPAARPRNRATYSSNTVSNDVINLDDSDVEDANPPQPEAEPQWACSQCTLLNPMTTNRCRACNLLNPSIPRPPDPVRRERLIDDGMGDDDEFVSDFQQYLHHNNDFPRRSRRNVQHFSTNNRSTSSASSLMAGGAVGAALGAAQAYANGSPIASGALQGAMSGAITTSLTHDFLNGQGVATSTPPRQSATRHSTRAAAAAATTQDPGFATQQSRGRRGAAATSADPMLDLLMQMHGHDTTGMDQSSADLFRQLTSPSMMMSRHRGFGGGMMAMGDSLDRMSYEQLLQRFGDGSEMLGANPGLIASLPSSIIQDVSNLPEDRKQCNICLEDFQNGDTRKILPCLHAFHVDCVDKWLRQNRACPICKHSVQDNQMASGNT